MRDTWPVQWHLASLLSGDGIVHHILRHQHHSNHKPSTCCPWIDQWTCVYAPLQDIILWTDRNDMNGIHMARLDKEEKIRGILHPHYGIAQDLVTFDIHNQPPYNSKRSFSGTHLFSRSRCCNTSHVWNWGIVSVIRVISNWFMNNIKLDLSIK